jgi:hypothetical protein
MDFSPMQTYAELNGITYFMRNRYNIWMIFFGLFLTASGVKAQQSEISIEFGPARIAQNEPFQVKLVVRNGSLQNYSAFPDIAGFVKAGTSTESSTNIYNGRVNREIKIVQSYMPQQQGKFTLKPFVMDANGEEVSSEGIVITVTEAKQRSAQNYPQRPRSLFDELFGNDNTEENPDDYIDLDDHAFLGLTADKNEVWMGEGFTTTLAFYIPDNEMYLFDFHKLNSQLNSLVRDIKPENCWEEGFQIYDIRRTPVEINGKPYGQYKLYQARYYPLNAQDVKFKALELDMVKYQISRRSDFFGRRTKKENVKTYTSEPLTVRVKDLPDHPLKDVVAVGDYRMQEALEPAEVETGTSFTYNFTISGQGNIASILAPEPNASPNLTLRGPKERSNSRKSGSTVIGVKEFSYTGEATEPGEYALADFINWIYFNPRTAAYDTLSPSATLRVTGESLRDQAIAANDPGSFYTQIDTASNKLRAGNGDEWQKWLFNILLAAMVVAVGFLYFSKKG